MVFFVYLGMSATGPDTAEFYIVGNALQLTAFSGIYGVTMTVGRERNEGTLGASGQHPGAAQRPFGRPHV